LDPKNKFLKTGIGNLAWWAHFLLKGGLIKSGGWILAMPCIFLNACSCRVHPSRVGGRGGVISSAVVPLCPMLPARI
jgi:hypothetical protein